MLSPSSAVPLRSTAFARYAIAVLALACVAVVISVAPNRAFDLDRFFVPKELVVHAAALLLVLPLAVRLRTSPIAGVDVLLLVFLGLSTLSATFATNHWLSTRALALTWSCLVLFWAASEVARAGWSRALLVALCVAVTAAALSSLLQAYGFDSPYFSTNRAPGGTLGNRNFVAHLAAIGASVLLTIAISARRGISAMLATVGIAVISATLVLSRSRAAWLALGLCLLVVLPGIWRARQRWPVPTTRRRVNYIALTIAVVVATTLVIPNRLEWRSDSPYLDSMKSVVDYKEGSGRGRLVQYTNTLRLALAHPLLGVGPGNWAVRYPALVRPGDPSLDDATDMTANPWPSSDWMAFVSERGWLATIALALAFIVLLGDAGRQLRRAGNLDEYLYAVALAGTLIAAVVAGAFDAVLLLPAPALLIWIALGALRQPPTRSLTLSPRTRAAIVAGSLLACGAATARSALELRAIGDFSRGALTSAVREDPGNYRIRLRIAEQAAGRGRCDLVRTHAGVAHALFPNAPAPRHLLAECRQ